MPPALSFLSMRRRWPWQLLFALLALLLVVHRLLPGKSFSLETWQPSALHTPAVPNYPPVLRPNDYVDKSRIRNIPDSDDDPPMSEPNGIGTLHDQRNERFYVGGLSTLTSRGGDSPQEPVVYDPYPPYNAARWRELWKGDFRACEGPRGVALNRSDLDDMLSVYRGNQLNFPFPTFGSYEAVGIDGNVCTDRCSRYTIYGHDEKNYHSGCREPPVIQWTELSWGKLQARCADRNANRYRTTDIHRVQAFPTSSSLPSRHILQPISTNGPSLHSRTAVIIRLWHDMKWTANHQQYVRSLIMELSLHTGGEYELFLLVDVKDPILPISQDIDIRRVMETYIPAEFHDMTILFNEETLKSWYPKIDEHRPKYQHLQPVQLFAQHYPHFDHYWQVEMDARYTGHIYHFLEQATQFAKKQPRKYLWERNSYFYTPGAHGTWSSFRSFVHHSMAGREHQSVWGPVATEIVDPIGPKPPVQNPVRDDYGWGIDEEADLITLLPIFDVQETNWTFPNKIWGVPSDLPRRAAPITMGRMSFQLLDTMHKAQRESGQGVVSEMSAPTWALLHGFKAVHVPHPLFVDGKWTAKELAPIMNRGKPEKVNGGPDSIWNWDHAFDHILYRISYMFTTQTAEDLFRRWLGFPADPNQYTDNSLHQDPQGRFWYDGGNLNEEKYSRLCYPPMFIHTVKNTAAEKGEDMAVPV